MSYVSLGGVASLGMGVWAYLLARSADGEADNEGVDMCVGASRIVHCKQSECINLPRALKDRNSSTRNAVRVTGVGGSKQLEGD